MPLKFYGEADTDPGDWFDWREGIRVKVRRITPANERAIENRYFGTRRRVRFRSGATEQDLDVRKAEEVNREKATYCMLDTEGFEMELAGSDGAGRIGKILGEELAEGQVVKLDGRWSEPLKKAIFEGLPDLMAWVTDRAQELAGRERDDEEEAQGN